MDTSLGLILVRTKFHTVALEEYLSEQPALKERQIAVGRLTGQGSAEELCLPGTQQATVLNEFRKGTTTLLVATGRPCSLVQLERTSVTVHVRRCGSGRLGCRRMFVRHSVRVRLERNRQRAEPWPSSCRAKQMLSHYRST